MCLPTGVDPVKDINPGMSWVTMASPISLPAPMITFNTPLGKPASSNNLASSRAPVTGVSLAGFNTTALPKAIAGASER